MFPKDQISRDRCLLLFHESGQLALVDDVFTQQFQKEVLVLMRPSALHLRLQKLTLLRRLLHLRFHLWFHLRIHLRFHLRFFLLLLLLSLIINYYLFLFILFRHLSHLFFFLSGLLFHLQSLFLNLLVDLLHFLLDGHQVAGLLVMVRIGL